MVGQSAQGNGKKIAVVGSGPSGLSCAFYLQKKGYEVTVFEEAPIVGGMLVKSPLSTRLPRDKLEKELNVYRTMGVKFQTSTKLGCDITIPGLRDKGYVAIYLALGARSDRALSREAEGYPDIFIDSSRTVNRLEAAALPGYRWDFGDIVTGPDTVVGAVSRGKQAASSIDRILGGNGQVIDLQPLKRELSKPIEETPSRRACFSGAVEGLTEEQAIDEAGRCLRCDVLKVRKL